MILFLSFIAFILLLVDLFMKQENFGEHPKDERLQRIQALKNYRNKKIENLNHTPVMVEGVSYRKVMSDFFFKPKPNSKPKFNLPSKKIDLNQLSADENILVWFGHSSYFLQVDGKKFLIDPVFSGAASPIAITTKSFAGSDIYSVEDMPDIDYLIITHDHWDHLDHKTVKQLRPKIGKVITSLGVGAHIELWGYQANQVIELHWGESKEIESGFKIHCTPARHFSGRGFKRALTLWSSFALKTPTSNLYLGGDSGYDTHFKEIGDSFGPFDLAILECGQYNPNWKYIHLMPEETVQAAIDLKAKTLLPVHWGKFVLALHEWNEPIIRVKKEASLKNMPLYTPLIGEKITLQQMPKEQREWWLSSN